MHLKNEERNLIEKKRGSQAGGTVCVCDLKPMNLFMDIIDHSHSTYALVKVQTEVGANSNKDKKSPGRVCTFSKPRARTAHEAEAKLTVSRCEAELCGRKKAPTALHGPSPLTRALAQREKLGKNGVGRRGRQDRVRRDGVRPPSQAFLSTQKSRHLANTTTQTQAPC